MKKSTQFAKASVIVLFLLLTAATAILGTRLYKNAADLKVYKKDFFKVNQIKYGLFNGDNWSWQLERIIEQQVDSFTISNKNKEVLHEQISKVMNRLLTEVDVILHEKQDKIGDNIKYKVLNSLVDINDFRDDVPKLANTVIAELDKSKNRNKVKGLLKEKISGLLTNEDVFVVPDREIYYQKYHVKNLVSFNTFIKKEATRIEAQQTELGYILISLMGFTLFLWWFLLKKKHENLYSYAFMFSVLISFVNLLIGITLPMIEIDARISELKLSLLSSNILFFDQVIFFQTKSILDVVKTLLFNGKVDTVIVGGLILAFSILFPVGKLVSATIYLFRRSKRNRFIKLMAFKSGKWSMADVMVVAIFMAYIGFQGILNDQMENLNIKEEHVNLLSTNKSKLQIGFLIFVSFVIFNLILSSILKIITKEPENAKGVEPKNQALINVPSQND